jgi:microcystin-dependent protein
MSLVEAFLAELKLMSFNFPPKGWAECNGQFLPINQNQALFSLLGTTYGGNGQTTFALPDLRGRIPIHAGDGFLQGQAAGQEFHTLTQSEMPQHIHVQQASSQDADVPVPAGHLLAGANNAYASPASLTALHPASVSNTGGSQPHENRHPYLVLNWCICLSGIFPSRN